MRRGTLLGLAALLAGLLVYGLSRLRAERSTVALEPNVAMFLDQSPGTRPGPSMDVADAPVRSDRGLPEGPVAEQTESRDSTGGNGAVDSALGDLRTDFDRIMLTCRTPNPDLQGLKDVVARLARSAVVVPGSVTTDPETGLVSGAIEVSGLALSGVFEIDGEAYQADLRRPIEGDEVFKLQALTVSFDADTAGVNGGTTVAQHHPDGRSSWREGDGAQYVGWSLTVGEQGSKAVPLIMQAAEVGPGGTISRLDAEAVSSGWDWDQSYLAEWFQVLTPFR